MTPRRLSACGLAVCVLAAVWLFLAPPALGGQTSYVVTSGVSMEPRFHTGDLALVRTQSSYSLGDIVAYRSPTLGLVVLHRIHSGDAAGFRTKGDNNTWLDPDTVRADEVLGKLWLHVPKAGIFLRNGTLLPGAAVLGAFSIVVPARARWRRRGQGSHRKASPVGGTSKRSHASALLTAATVAGVGGAGLLLLATVATAPAASAPAAAVTHALELTYQAPADAAVYQGGELVTGDPVFLKLNPTIDVHLADAAIGTPAAAGGRTLRLQARLLGPGGWQYTVPLPGQASGEAGQSDLLVHLDLRALQSVITEAGTRTGQPGSSYQVQLLPTVDSTAAGADGAPLVIFKPVVFQFAAGQLVLANAADRRGAPVTRTATEPGRASTVAPGPAKQVHLAGLSLSASVLTAVGIVLLVLAAAMLAAGLLRRRSDPLGGLTQPLITVAARDLGAKTVMTASVDELFALARQYNRPVLSMVVAGRPTYAVEEGGTWYGCYLGRGAEADEYADDDFPGPPAPRAAAEDSLDTV